MTTFATDIERPSILFAAPPHPGQTLEDLVSGVWEDLRANRTATCPICDGELAPRFGSGASAVGGRCRSCGSELV